MFSLKRRRLRGDRIEMFQMIHGIEEVNLRKLFCMDEDEKTRKHSLFKNQKACKLEVVNYWNHLPDIVVGCKSLATLEIKLDEFMTKR